MSFAANGAQYFLAFYVQTMYDSIHHRFQEESPMAKNEDEYISEDFEEEDTLGSRINELRLDNEMSYTELGKLLGVSRQTAANYCSGKTVTIPKDKLDQICTLFQVSPAYLLSESNVRSDSYPINVSCKFTGLSEEAVIRLHTSHITSDALNYMLENTEEDFWSNLLGFFAVSVPREDSRLEFDPFQPSVIKFSKAHPNLDFDSVNAKLAFTKRDIIQQVLLMSVERSLLKLKKEYWRWVMKKGKEETLAKKSPYKEVKSADMIDRIDRVTDMEKYMKSATETIMRLNIALSSFRTVQNTINYLDGYYQSPDWKEDFEADEAGLFPDDLPRGVLSEDGIYNLLEQNEDLWERLRTFAQEAEKRKNKS